MKAILFSFSGSLRQDNEDAMLGSVVYSRMNMAAPSLEQLSTESAIIAVADGVGGNVSGAEAAESILKTLAEYLSPLRFQIDNAQTAVAESLNLAADRLSAMSMEDTNLKGLGATIAGIWICADKALIFNVGDCRVYRVRHGYLDQLSQDHSVVFQLYSNGEITEDEMSTHPQKHIITSSIDDTSHFDLFSRRLSIKNGDIFLICSDGVWETLKRNEIEECFAENEAEIGAHNLADTLPKDECRDNASFVVVYV